MIIDREVTADIIPFFILTCVFIFKIITIYLAMFCDWWRTLLNKRRKKEAVACSWNSTKRVKLNFHCRE